MKRGLKILLFLIITALTASCSLYPDSYYSERGGSLIVNTDLEEAEGPTTVDEDDGPADPIDGPSIISDLPDDTEIVGSDDEGDCDFGYNDPDPEENENSFQHNGEDF